MVKTAVYHPLFMLSFYFNLFSVYDTGQATFIILSFFSSQWTVFLVNSLRKLIYFPFFIGCFILCYNNILPNSFILVPSLAIIFLTSSSFVGSSFVLYLFFLVYFFKVSPILVVRYFFTQICLTFFWKPLKLLVGFFFQLFVTHISIFSFIF